MRPDRDNSFKSIPQRTRETLEALQLERQKLRELALAHARLKERIMKRSGK